ncbi:hypothetical protein VTP01DRAFT_7349 [Rhizomucor pusillus]|uniref:uncharacterized protein n=1 Tax=Rhizomucor pusillus TaxID=4840 RepID=UPI003743E06E
MKAQEIALWSAGVATALGLGYLVYFDYKRRNDPAFRKHLKKQRKQAAKAAKEEEKKSEEATIKLIEKVIVSGAQETYPTTPQDREQFFMAQVSAGETLCAQGAVHYDEAVIPFYKALKVYPDPNELLMIYQKTIPQPVFEIVVKALAIEQQILQSSGAAAQPAEEPEIPIE